MTGSMTTANDQKITDLIRATDNLHAAMQTANKLLERVAREGFELIEKLDDYLLIEVAQRSLSADLAIERLLLSCGAADGSEGL